MILFTFTFFKFSHDSLRWKLKVTECRMNEQSRIKLETGWGEGGGVWRGKRIDSSYDWKLWLDWWQEDWRLGTSRNCVVVAEVKRQWSGLLMEDLEEREEWELSWGYVPGDRLAFLALPYTPIHFSFESYFSIMTITAESKEHTSEAKPHINLSPSVSSCNFQWFTLNLFLHL